jgi:hypothetical protein
VPQYSQVFGGRVVVVAARRAIPALVQVSSQHRWFARCGWYSVPHSSHGRGGMSVLRRPRGTSFERAERHGWQVRTAGLSGYGSRSFPQMEHGVHDSSGRLATPETNAFDLLYERVLFLVVSG